MSKVCFNKATFRELLFTDDVREVSKPNVNVRHNKHTCLLLLET